MAFVRAMQTARSQLVGSETVASANIIVTDGSVVIVGAYVTPPSNLTSIVDQEGAYTEIGTVLTIASGKLYLFIRTDTTAQTLTVVATANDAGSQLEIAVIEITGVDLASPTGSTANGTGSGNDLATAADLEGEINDVIIAVGAVPSTTVDTGWFAGETFSVPLKFGIRLQMEARILHSDAVAAFAATMRNTAVTAPWLMRAITVLSAAPVASVAVIDEFYRLSRS